MKYCIYLRKSRSDNDGEFSGELETLARHESILLELAKRQKLEISKIYREVTSGENISSRPIMYKLLHEVECGFWDGVLVMEIERLARGDTIDQGIMAQAFKYSNTKIITPIKTYDPNNEFDEEYFEFGLFMSRREYKTINRRLQRGRILSAKEGKFVGNTPPYGYIRIKLQNDKGFSLEPHKEESKVVKLIFQLYAFGELQANGTYSRLGIASICNKLNLLHLKPRQSQIWVSSSIREILTNPVYIGKIRWNCRPLIKKISDGNIVMHRPRSSSEDCLIVDGLHKSIIDDKTWSTAQSFFKKNSFYNNNFNIKNPLAGIVYCGICGKSMIRRPYTNKKPDILMCPNKFCKNISSKLFIVENNILLALEKWLCDYTQSYVLDNQNVNPDLQINITKKILKKLDLELDKTKIQIENLHDFFEQKIYSKDIFLERLKILLTKLETINQDKISINSSFDNKTLRKKNAKIFLPKISNIISIYSKIKSPKIKNDFLKTILKKVYYIKSINSRWHSSSDDFEMHLFPKIPK